MLIIKIRKMSSSANFLWSAANLLPTDNRAQILLKSYYLTKIRKETNVTDIKAFGDEELCKKCSTLWTDVHYSMSIKPIKKSKRKSRKILSLIGDKTDLKKQKYAKKSLKNVNNLMVIKCNVCKNRKNVILWKQTSTSDAPKTELSNTTSAPLLVSKSTKITAKTAEISTNTKKRKRNKDKTAGLILPISTQKKVANMPIIAATSHPPQSQSTIKVVQQGQKQQPQHQMKNTNRPKTKLNAKKPTLKLISPVAHKKNSLLHLANALKIKSNSNTEMDNKLQKMLR